MSFLMLLLLSRSAELSALTFLCAGQSRGTIAQGQEKLAQSEVFLLSLPANLAPFKDTVFFSPLKKTP